MVHDAMDTAAAWVELPGTPKRYFSTFMETDGAEQIIRGILLDLYYD